MMEIHTVLVMAMLSSSNGGADLRLPHVCGIVGGSCRNIEPPKKKQPNILIKRSPSITILKVHRDPLLYPPLMQHITAPCSRD